MGELTHPPLTGAVATLPTIEPRGPTKTVPLKGKSGLPITAFENVITNLLYCQLALNAFIGRSGSGLSTLTYCPTAIVNLGASSWAFMNHKAVSTRCTPQSVMRPPP